MPRGGYRPGAGRPKDSKTLRVDVRKRASATGQTPLEFMLSVMNDETQDMNTRLRMAAAAAPFIHGRKTRFGKRAQAATRTRKPLPRKRAGKTSSIPPASRRTSFKFKDERAF